jgi:hypothetical protein
MDNINIYTYWNTPELPLLNKKCIDNWKRLNPDYNIIVLNEENIINYIDSFPKNYDILIHQHKSDYIRTYILYHYGGIWIDNTIILKTNLNEIFDFNIRDKLQIFNFYACSRILKNKSMRNMYFSNCFMCSLDKNNELIKAWLNNYIWCIENMNAINNNNYKNIIDKSVYFKNLYSNRFIKSHRVFIKSYFTYYLTNMNILAILLHQTDFYHKYLHKLNDTMNLLLMDKNESDNFNYDKNKKFIKLVHCNRDVIMKLIQDNKINEDNEIYNLLELHNLT